MTDYPPEISEEKMRAALLLPGHPYPSSTAHNNPKVRRRFVQDGEVPVVVVNPRQHRLESEERVALANLTRELAVERATRAVVEKELQAAKDMVRQLQTRVAHAEFALKEAKSVPPVPLTPAPMPSPAPDVASDEQAPLQQQRRRTVRIRNADPVRAISESAVKTDNQTQSHDDTLHNDDESIAWWEPGWREKFRARGS